jgi:uncharacterized membrane protein YkvA (DUF1232 family)
MIASVFLRRCPILYCVQVWTTHVGGTVTPHAIEEKALKRIFTLWRMVAGQDLRVLWFALRHQNRPGWLLPGLAGLALFAVEPVNFAIPMLGAVDEFVLVPLILHGMVKMLPAHVHDGFAHARPGRFRRRT